MNSADCCTNYSKWNSQFARIAKHSIKSSIG